MSLRVHQVGDTTAGGSGEGAVAETQRKPEVAAADPRPLDWVFLCNVEQASIFMFGKQAHFV